MQYKNLGVYKNRGFYQNPIILCDYSDPDVIRVGDIFYMVASSFNFMPGLPILTSKNLVDWELVNYACKRIPYDWYDEPQNAKGIWAPSIRFHEGKFYIFVGMPDEGLFYTETENPFGEWSELKAVWEGKGFEDPCPIWEKDEDGKEHLYLVHGYVKSRIGFNSKLGLLELDLESKKAISEDKIIFDGTKSQPTIEGPKFYKRNGYFYIFAPAGGVTEGWQTVLRSKKIDGDYEERIVLSQGNAKTNGPHQGAWVTTAKENKEGIKDWFVHFQERGVFGRIVHLQPMKWNNDDWCVMGNAVKTNAECGEPVEKFEMPNCETDNAISTEKESVISSLSRNPFLDFQFSANPKKEYAEVFDDKIKLNCVASKNALWKMANVLTKKIDSENFDFECEIDFSNLQNDSRFGMIFMGDEYKALEISKTDDNYFYSIVESCGGEKGDDERTEKISKNPLSVSEKSAKFTVSFRKTDERSGLVTVSFENSGNCVKISEFSVKKAHWVGGRFGFYASKSEECDNSFVIISKINQIV